MPVAGILERAPACCAPMDAEALFELQGGSCWASDSSARANVVRWSEWRGLRLRRSCNDKVGESVSNGRSLFGSAGLTTARIATPRPPDNLPRVVYRFEGWRSPKPAWSLKRHFRVAGSFGLRPSRTRTVAALACASSTYRSWPLVCSKKTVTDVYKPHRWHNLVTRQAFLPRGLLRRGHERACPRLPT